MCISGYRGEETYQAYDGWGQAMFTQWLSMYGLFAYPREEDGFFLVGIIAVSIVLLNLLAINLLIAMMNATYSKIAEVRTSLNMETGAFMCMR